MPVGTKYAKLWCPGDDINGDWKGWSKNLVSIKECMYTDEEVVRSEDFAVGFLRGAPIFNDLVTGNWPILFRIEVVNPVPVKPIGCYIISVNIEQLRVTGEIVY